MDRVKILQIGVSHDHAQDIFDSLLALSNIYEVIGYVVCPEEEDYFYQLPDKHIFNQSTRLTLDEALSVPGLQAVTVECTEQELTKYATIAAKRGLHIHMDKPGSVDSDTYEALIDLCQREKAIFHVGYMYRYNPAIREIFRIVRNGELGEIYRVEVHMSCLLTKEKRQWLEQFPGGMMFYLGCHLIDLIFSLQGKPDQVISLNKSSGFDGVKAKDTATAILCYKNGISYACSNAVEAGGGVRRQLVVLGEKGSLELRPIERWIPDAVDRMNIISELRITHKEEAMRVGGMCMPEKTIMGPFNRYDTMMESFASMVNGTANNEYSYEHERMLHNLLVQACGE